MASSDQVRRSRVRSVLRLAREIDAPQEVERAGESPSSESSSCAMITMPAHDCGPCSGSACVDDQTAKNSSNSSSRCVCGSCIGGDRRQRQRQRQRQECACTQIMRPRHQPLFSGVTTSPSSFGRMLHQSQSRHLGRSLHLDEKEQQQQQQPHLQHSSVPTQHDTNTKSMRQHQHTRTRLRSRSFNTFSFQLLQLVFITMTIIQLLFMTMPVVTAQDDTAAATSGIASVDNPKNQFCGLTYEEAHQFCHLEPHKSLPCPGGSEEEGKNTCPYSMPCWEIKEECTPPPTVAPTTLAPVTGSPITAKSEDAGDHHFCGLGFDNLFGCAINCPNGSPAECPSGQLCYFNTPCDARMEGRLISDPTQKPVPIPTLSPTVSHAPQKPTLYGMGRHNFCGASYDDAADRCSFDTHCPYGNNDECAEDMFCYVDVKGCDVFEFPTMRPTISPKPTYSPSIAPTTPNPANTFTPTDSPLDKDDIRKFFFCGVDWGDASKRCYKRCLSGAHVECAEDEKCFAQAGCKGVKEDQSDSKKDDASSSNSTDFPTPVPVEGEEPTMAPIEADDYRNFFFCGTSWMDATKRCYKRCLTGRHHECPDDEECYAQADCKKGVIVPKTERPTTAPSPAPFDGTLSPTTSPEPTNLPTTAQPTMSPSPPPTLSPQYAPTGKPTTPYPTHHPTYAPCAGEPCGNKEHCRSKQNFCGAGKYYCNEKSIWVASCGVPTDPPLSVAPTTIWPSMNPSSSSEPSKVRTSPPTESPITTDSPTTSSPTDQKPPSVSPTISPTIKPTEAAETSSPTFLNVDLQYFAPEDPLGSFFCGKDWVHAIEECPHRCPSGEADQCPKGWQCYAFTPCLGIGINEAPTVKPTWEPTKEPTPRPTAVPTTAQQYWVQKNDEKYGDLPLRVTSKPTQPTPKPIWWTPAPTPRPSYAPTEDQCDAQACDYEGECRSRLGFCGTGIVYCNSASTWVPKCGGSPGLIRLDKTPKPTPTASPNTGPSPAPLAGWQMWVNNENASPDNASSDATDAPVDDTDTYSSQSIGESTAAHETFVITTETGIVEEEPLNEKNEDDYIEDDDTPKANSNANSGYAPEAWDNWGNQERLENEGGEFQDQRWWIVPNSTGKSKDSSPVRAVLWALIFLAFIHTEY